MKNLFYTLLIVLCSSSAFSQTGIGTTTPKATLDVQGKPADAAVLDGMIPPRLTGDQLRAKTYTSDQTGAMVYVTAADTAPAGQTVNVSSTGYYFFDGSVWVLVKPQQGLVNSLNFSQSGAAGVGGPIFIVPINLLAASTKLKLTFTFLTDNVNGSTAIWTRTMNPLTGWVAQSYTGPCGASAVGGYYQVSVIMNRPVPVDGLMIVYLPLNSGTFAGCQNQTIADCNMTIQVFD